MYTTNSMLRARLLRDGGPGTDPAAGGSGPGGGPTSSGGQPSSGQPAGGAGSSGEDQLGEAGKAALDRERAAAREAARLKTAAEQRADAAEAELKKLQEATQSEAEKATAKAVQDATTTITEAANKRLVRAEVKAAAAAAQFHDPVDAALLLADRFDQVKVDKNGVVDEAAARSLVDQLAKDKPHLIKSAGTATRTLPGQGHQGTAPVSGRDAGLAEARRRFGEPSKTTT